MDFPSTLSYVQNQFPGQLVLYVNDIAKILRKSDKAVSDLITRHQLPFQVKTVGRLRCVDIFQVAQWLSSGQEPSNELISSPTKPPPSKGKPRPIKPVKAPLVDEPAPTGKVAAMLLKMRHSQAEAMGRFVYDLESPDDMAFMNEVMEKLFYTADLLTSGFVVTVKKLSPVGAKVLALETRKYFENEDDAYGDLRAQLKSWQTRSAKLKSKRVEHFILEKSGETVVHAIASTSNLAFICNTTGFTLPSIW